MYNSKYQAHWDFERGATGWHTHLKKRKNGEMEYGTVASETKAGGTAGFNAFARSAGKAGEKQRVKVPCRERSSEPHCSPSHGCFPVRGSGKRRQGQVWAGYRAAKPHCSERRRPGQGRKAALAASPPQDTAKLREVTDPKHVPKLLARNPGGPANRPWPVAKVRMVKKKVQP